MLRQMITTFVSALLGAEADVVCGVEYGVHSEERTNTRNGYRRSARRLKRVVTMSVVGWLRSAIWRGKDPAPHTSGATWRHGRGPPAAYPAWRAAPESPGTGYFGQ